MVNIYTTINVKFTLEQDTQRPRRGVDYISTLSLTLALDGVGGQGHAPVTLLPWKTQNPLYRRLGGPQSGLEGLGISYSYGDSIPGPSSS